MRSAVKAGNRREKKNRKSEFLDSKGGFDFEKSETDRICLKSCCHFPKFFSKRAISKFRAGFD
ncbi:2-deoxy-scyllo-inosamine dehydrogenase [Leptospira santarosai]|uniref:Uncharacterized protein n=1 Tax=Leptospira santarosai serovar Shermani str. LT 821 TaxID=758847 RepID=K8XVI0_9LEPT|nr:hypothetical protein LSS_17930 [Leptospira santarosai serovar Shermani str. LT 821]KXZ32862.1 2-deoxy-scyllo-inosamine dehydrogenase [Leptospira santarosai]